MYSQSKSFISYKFYKYFLPVYGMLFFSGVFWRRNVFNFGIIQLIHFLFVVCDFYVECKKTSLTQGLNIFSFVFYRKLKYFINILNLLSPINWFLYDIRYGSSFIFFFIWISNCTRIIYLKKILSQWISLLP